MKELKFETGIVEMSVNGKRSIQFNPSDIGFLETLYELIGKIESISAETAKKKDKADDPAKLFDYSRVSDEKMRKAVDSVFGEGFCEDVFQGVRLIAIANGLTVLENFIFAIVDEMDESVRENMAKRNDRIAKYTAKYQRHKNAVPLA